MITHRDLNTLTASTMRSLLAASSVPHEFSGKGSRWTITLAPGDIEAFEAEFGDSLDGPMSQSGSVMLKPNWTATDYSF